MAGKCSAVFVINVSSLGASHALFGANCRRPQWVRYNGRNSREPVMQRFNTGRRIGPRLVLPGLAGLSLLAAAACRASPEGKEERNVVFSAEKPEMSVAAQPGDVIVVKLPAKPGTGQTWKITS